MRELFDSMGAREFALWMAFYLKDPPDKSEQFRTGLICSSIYNASGNLKRGTTAKPEDFMPKGKPKELSPQESEAALRAFFSGAEDG